MSKVELSPLPEPWNYAEWQFTGEQMRAYATAEVLKEREATRFSSLLEAARICEDLKKPCSDDPESQQAIINAHYMNCSYAIRARAALKGTT